MEKHNSTHSNLDITGNTERFDDDHQSSEKKLAEELTRTVDLTPDITKQAKELPGRVREATDPVRNFMEKVLALTQQSANTENDNYRDLSVAIEDTNGRQSLDDSLNLLVWLSRQVGDLYGEVYGNLQGAQDQVSALLDYTQPITMPTFSTQEKHEENSIEYSTVEEKEDTTEQSSTQKEEVDKKGFVDFLYSVGQSCEKARVCIETTQKSLLSHEEHSIQKTTSELRGKFNELQSCSAHLHTYISSHEESRREDQPLEAERFSSVTDIQQIAKKSIAILSEIENTADSVSYQATLIHDEIDHIKKLLEGFYSSGYTELAA